MENIHIKEINNLENITEGHVLYFFEDSETYMQNVIDFVIAGLDQDEYSVIIENDRILPSLQKRLESTLDDSQLSKVKFANNFDFYYAKGDFRSNSIFEFFPKLSFGDPKQELAVRSWAHIEWRDEHEVCEKLSISEREADVIVKEARLLSVCAYDLDRVSEELKDSLLTSHSFLIYDQENKQKELKI